MRFDDDVLLMLSDFGKTASFVEASGATYSGEVLFQMPTADILGDMQMSSDYSITYSPAHFPGLRHGSEITVAGVTYIVREIRDAEDGLTKTASLKA